MNPYNLQTSVLTLLVASATACGTADSPLADDGRNESFLALMSSDGKADGLTVTEGSIDAIRVLDVANTYSFAELEAEVGLDRRATANIIAHREQNPESTRDDDPYDSLRELDSTPWIGMRAFSALLAHTRTLCDVEQCYVQTGVSLPLEGDLSFDVGSDGSWWVRAHADGSTVREARGVSEVSEVDTTTYPDPDLDNWVARLPDGTLTAVSRSGSQVVPEFGPAHSLPSLSRAVTAAYSSDGELFVAAEAHDSFGAPQGVIILRQAPEGWREELKHPLEGIREPGEAFVMQFTRGADGHMQLWVDVDGAARRFDRAEDGAWRESMLVDMVEAGFGAKASEREVSFLQAENGTVYIHRSTWQFARRHELVRIDGSAMMSVRDLAVAARHVVPHPEQAFSVLYADGSVGYWRNGTESRGPATLAPLNGTEQVRTNGEQIFVLRDSELKILTPR